ncbi:MAG: 2-isopropylmalate synthase [Endomicrobiales bacterium]|nr:2-isopropylmalate synthase [Endomicrobiales bacterium]
MDKNRVIIFDTTLRDGEQSPGASMNIKEKIKVAHQLARLGVDVIEAGFPISSPGDFESVKEVAKAVKGPSIAGLCRCNEKDITACWNAVKYSKKPRIHTFIATSDIHIRRKLQKTREEVVEIAERSVRFAKRFCDDVEFSAEDAVRSDFNYLCQVVEAVIEAGATTVNIPDTVGYAIPEEYGRMIKDLKNRVENIEKVVLSVHCHNDLGLGVANSLAAVANGARQVECTVNGLGERAGNASLEEVVMALNTRKQFFGLTHGIKTKEIYQSSRLVSSVTGIMVQPNKAVVGANAFAHEAGIHQDGVLKERLTYEIMKPQDVGVPSNKLVLGKHSGRHALIRRLKDLGYHIPQGEVERVYGQFKALADKKKSVYDDDIIALVEESMGRMPEVYALEYLNTSSGTGIIPTATVRLVKDEKPSASSKNAKKGGVIQEAACGDGPVDAAYKAIDKITRIDAKLTDYTLKAISGGQDAQGEVNVKVEHRGVSYTGRGTSTDIIEASAKAYLQALNKIIAMTKDNKKKVRESL